MGTPGPWLQGQHRQHVPWGLGVSVSGMGRHQHVSRACPYFPMSWQLSPSWKTSLKGCRWHTTPPRCLETPLYQHQPWSPC